MKKRFLFFLFFLVLVGLLGCEGMTLPSGITLPTTAPVTTTTSLTGSDTSATEVPTTAASTSGSIETTQSTSMVSTTEVPTTVVPTTTTPTDSSNETTQPSSAATTTVSTTVPVTSAPTTTTPTTQSTTAPSTTSTPTTTTPTTTTPTTQSTTIPITTTTEPPTTTTTVSSYVVIFMADGEVHHQTSVSAGSQVEAPVEPEVAGKTFAGWYLPTSEVAVTFPVTVNENLTFTASFNDIITEKENHFFLRIKNQTATTLEVEVVLGGDPLKINGYDLRVTYDIAAMQYVSHVNNVVDAINTNNPGVVSFNYSNVMTALTNETVLLTITYSLSLSGSTDIGMTVIGATVVDESYNIFSPDTNATGLTVTND